MNAHLTIDSNDPDICGDWNAADEEAEMIDLEIPIENSKTWLEYVLDHNFEDYSLDTNAIVKLLDSSDSIMIDMMYGGTRIHIEYSVY